MTRLEGSRGLSGCESSGSLRRLRSREDCGGWGRRGLRSGLGCCYVGVGEQGVQVGRPDEAEAGRELDEDARTIAELKRAR